jgi:hypothetical protein
VRDRENLCTYFNEFEGESCTRPSTSGWSTAPAPPISADTVWPWARFQPEGLRSSTFLSLGGVGQGRDPIGTSPHRSSNPTTAAKEMATDADDETYEQCGMPRWAPLLVLFPPALPFFFRSVSVASHSPTRTRTRATVTSYIIPLPHAHSVPRLHRYRVKLTRDWLEFGYSTALTRVTVSTDEIVEASVIQVSGLSQWGGWGIRYNGVAWGYIASNGPALQITRMFMNPHYTNRVYVFSCDDPDAVLRKLRDGRCSKLRQGAAE